VEDFWDVLLVGVVLRSEGLMKSVDDLGGLWWLVRADTEVNTEVWSAGLREPRRCGAAVALEASSGGCVEVL